MPGRMIASARQRATPGHFGVTLNELTADADGGTSILIQVDGNAGPTVSACSPPGRDEWERSPMTALS